MGLTALLRGVVPGLNGFALFCCAVAVATPLLGGPVALISATVVAVLFAVGLQAVGCPRLTASPRPGLETIHVRRLG